VPRATNGPHGLASRATGCHSGARGAQLDPPDDRDSHELQAGPWSPSVARPSRGRRRAALVVAGRPRLTTSHVRSGMAARVHPDSVRDAEVVPLACQIVKAAEHTCGHERSAPSHRSAPELALHSPPIVYRPLGTGRPCAARDVHQVAGQGKGSPSAAELGRPKPTAPARPRTAVSAAPTVPDGSAADAPGRPERHVTSRWDHAARRTT
jgi:hypothetical protein